MHYPRFADFSGNSVFVDVFKEVAYWECSFVADFFCGSSDCVVEFLLPKELKLT